MPKNDDEDGPAIPRTISADDMRTHTGSHRALSSSDVDTLIKAQTAAAKREADRQSFDDLRLLAVELVGRDGDGGRLATMEGRLDAVEAKQGEHGTLIQQLVEFRGKAVFLASLLVAGGGVLAGLAAHFIDKALK